MVNKQQIYEGIRWVVAMTGGFLIGKGYVTQEHLNTFVDKLPEIISGIAAISTLVWGLFNRTNRSTVVQASEVPGVKAVIVDTTTGTSATAGVVAAASSADAPKVVPA